MNTHVWTVPSAQAAVSLKTHPAIRQAAAALREGRLIAFPTETVYGLGADATNDRAVANIFAAKKRPADNPLIVHVAGRSQLSDIVARIPRAAETLLDHFWPGPLTIVFPAAEHVSAAVTAGLNTVAVRMPDHPVAAALLQAAGRPVAAPSANRSGRPSPTEAKHVLDDLDGRIYGVIDGGKTGFGVESTVLDVTGETPAVLRPGGVTIEALRAVIGDVTGQQESGREGESPRSPGVKYRHYAPRGKMTLVTGEGEALVRRIQSLTDAWRSAGLTVGILTTVEGRARYDADLVIACGRRAEPVTVAQDLYRALRRFDDAGVERVLSETFPETGWGAVIMNRLRHAAGGRII